MGLLGNKKYNSNKNKNIIESFKHAYNGVIYAVTRERNMHIHITVAILVILFGIFFEISYVEWLSCLILIGLVISLELVNTAIEATVDLITIEENPLAKVAKDTSAGAVFVLAILSAFIGIIIFLPKVFDFLINL